MQDKLALLCEQQLNAILAEADVAFGNIIGAATTTLQLSDALQAPENGHNARIDPATGIADEMRKLMVYLQFHDEFSQRLHHVIALCRLFRDSAATSADDPALLRKLADIFSVSSEFTVLQTIFPEFRHEKPEAAIELF